MIRSVCCATNLVTVREVVLMVASLRKASPTMPVMVRVDSEYTASKLDGLNIDVVVKPFNIPKEVKRTTLYHNRGAILAKIDVAGEAVAKWGNTLLVDSDVIFFKLPIIPRGAKDVVFTWGSRGKRPLDEDGKFNAGMLWVENQYVISRWRQAMLDNTGGFYEQGCLDFLADWFPSSKVFSENNNWGWWRQHAFPIPKRVRSVHFHMLRDFDHQMGNLVRHTQRMREWFIQKGYLREDVRRIFNLPEVVSVICNNITVGNYFMINSLKREARACGVTLRVNPAVEEGEVVRILSVDEPYTSDGIIPSKESIRELHFRLFGYYSGRADIIAYTYGKDCGLGEAASDNIDAMEELGILVESRLWKGAIHDSDKALSDPDQIYYHHWHPQRHEKTKDWEAAGFGKGAKHIMFWAYEAEEGLPKEFKGILPYVSEIWTPSNFCKSIFSVTGSPIKVVPHKVQNKPLQDLHFKKKGEITVLYVFDAWSTLERKNPSAVIRVFKKAFKGVKAKLILKAHHLRKEDVDKLKRQCAEIDDKVEFINATVTNSVMERLFSRADILLSLQRSEGFGLNIAKALGRGIPVITTGYGGLLDFCNEGNSFLVDFKMVNVASSKGNFYREGRWASPNEGEAVRLLKRVYDMVVSDDPVLDEMRQRGIEMISDSFSRSSLRNSIECCFNLLGSGFSVTFAQVTPITRYNIPNIKRCR